MSLPCILPVVLHVEAKMNLDTSFRSHSSKRLREPCQIVRSASSGWALQAGHYERRKVYDGVKAVPANNSASCSRS